MWAVQRAALTPRQRQVLDLLAKRYTNQQIAQELGISLEGAKWHVREVLEVTGASSREEAAEMWRAENGLPRRLWRMTWGAGLVAGVVSVVALLAVVVLVAVTGRDNGKELAAPTPGTAASPTLTATLEPTATQPPATAGPSPVPTPRPLQAPSRATGNALLDDLVSHVEAGVAWDRRLIGTTPVPCRAEVYITHPECPGGAPDDTLVNSVFLFRCEAKWVDPDRLTDANLGDRTTTLVLHSVVAGGRPYTRSPIPPKQPDYWLLFRGGGPPGSSGFAVAVADGKVVSWGSACGTFEELEQRILEGSSGYLLPPA